MSDALGSWKEGAAKSAIEAFVARVTAGGSADFVPPEDRIATFDNDGTLWCEQPLPVQIFFAQDRLKALAAADPSMRERQPFKAFLEHDMTWRCSAGRSRIRVPRSRCFCTTTMQRAKSPTTANSA